MDITYRCPHCGKEFSGQDCRCGACGRRYQAVRVGDTKVVDFLSVCSPHTCRCPEHLGERSCQIDLAELTAPDPAARPYHHKSKILRALLELRGKLILDVGCREAPIGHLLAGQNDVVGVDLCPRMMLVETPNALDKGYRELWIADSHNLPIADGQADVLIATDILEHALRPERLLAEFFRALRSGGRLVVTVPNLVCYNTRISILLGSGVGIELHQLLKGKSPVNPISGPRYPDQRQHLRWFTLKSLAALLEEGGFRVEKKMGYDPVLSRIPGFDRVFRNLCLLVAAVAVKP